MIFSWKKCKEKGEGMIEKYECGEKDYRVQ